MNTTVFTASEIAPGEIDRLSLLADRMVQENTLEGKIALLKSEPEAETLFSSLPPLKYTQEEELAIRAVLAIRQEEVFAKGKQAIEAQLSNLVEVNAFYAELGGIVGYHLTLLQLLTQTRRRFSVEMANYHAPQGLDLKQPSRAVQEAIYYAIEEMDKLSEIYPIGGAGDRLNLQDAATKSPLPAALLSFKGKPMLEGLIEDLQAREYLYYKIKGKQITLPVALMTSKEKSNHDRILHLMEQKGWFARSKDKFAFFCQPLVPVVTRDGKWVVLESGHLLLKPGGHGVVWKLARDQGIFSWLEQQGVKKAIIRQINNPISSEDYGLLAFCGHGIKENKKFGFASCERQVRASEGVNVVVEEKRSDGFSYTLTNIEYCDFHMYGMEDEPAGPNQKHSKFPSNTNLLFVDLTSILQALEICPIPGVLANIKKIHLPSEKGESRELEVARLESTMQNIADCFQQFSSRSLTSEELTNFDSYITFNVRRKTIAATKREYFVGGSLLETPEGCFLEGMENMKELLQEHCLFSLPPWQENFVVPPCLFYYHPALGPLYSVIGQKVRKGRMGPGSELQLNLAECDIEEIDIEGSFLVFAERVLGELDAEGILHYSENVGRCKIKNVRVRNRGIDYSQNNIFWRRDICREESVKVYLQGNSEFLAQDVTIQGDWTFVIEDGWRGILQEQQGTLVLVKEKIESPSWCWKYFFDEEKKICIAMNELGSCHSF